MSPVLERAIPTGQFSDWLVAALPRLSTPLSFDVLGGGHSNVTVLVRDAAGKRVVLRRPPLGAQPRGAHDVLREARVMTAAGSQGIPVAEVLATCADTRVLGAPFAVTAFIDGAVVDNPPAVEQHLPLVATRVQVADELVDTLAALHAVEPTAAGLGDLVRTETFLERQLRRYAALWADDRTRELPLVDELHRRLVAARPAERYRGLVHADFRLGNCLVGPDGRLRAVLDWELAAVGDVLADLAIFLNNWAAPGTDAARVWMEIPPTCAGGFPTADQLLERYVARSQRRVDDLEYYRAFSWWRMAVIAEGIRRRYEGGAMAASVDLDHVNSRVEWLAELADAHLRAHGA